MHRAGRPDAACPVSAITEPADAYHAYNPVTGCAIFHITPGGKLLAEKISAALENNVIYDCKQGMDEKIRAAWQNNKCLVFIMATGVVIRKIAPLINDKRSDPCVLALDEKGQHVISLLSGHVGGGNQLARKLAEITGGQAVITTASDVLGHTAIDLWAQKYNLVADDSKKISRVAGTLISRGILHIYSNCGFPELPHDLKAVTSPGNADIIITIKSDLSFQKLVLHPQILAVGIGCNRGTSAEDIRQAVMDTVTLHRISPLAIRALATIDVKKDEKGIKKYARDMKLPILFYSKDEINRVQDINISRAAVRAVGAKGVAEPAAILGANNGKLIVKKVKYKDVTVAIAQDILPWPSSTTVNV